METISNPTITFIGGGTTGETAAGFQQAIEARLIPGITTANINAVVSSGDNGSWTRYFRDRYRLHAPGDYRRTMSAMSGNPEVAHIMEFRYDKDASMADIVQSGDDLLAATAPDNMNLSRSRTREIIDTAVAMGHDITKDVDDLRSLTFGHLIVSSLMVEHRTLGKGKNVQTALDEASALMEVRGRVIADSLVPFHLEMRDGSKHIFGQKNIDKHTIENSGNVEVWASPVEPFHEAPLSPTAEHAVAMSDALVSVHGSLYGSKIAPFLVKNMPEAMAKSADRGAQFIILSNLVAEGTEGRGMNGMDYVKEIEKYAGRTCTRIVCNDNTRVLPPEEAISFDPEEFSELKDYQIVTADLVADTNVHRGPNNPKTTKVRTNMTVAAIAALASKPQEVLVAA